MVDVIIDQVKDRCEQIRDIDAICGLMIHRVGINLRTGAVIGTDGVSICEAFIGLVPEWHSVAAATGYQNAYTFIIGGEHGHADDNGRIWQALELDEIGHHGRRFSKGHIGIALIGDFRIVPPTERQWNAAMDLCADLCLLLCQPARHVVGHGEMAGAHGGNKAPGQPAACPGDFLDMNAFRTDVKAEMVRKLRQDAIWRLESVGVRLP
jgi:hypothetical protein